MLYKTRALRVIALVLIFNMGLQIFSPMMAWASLTAGPNAPEYTSFEPVDTTDMVNLSSGDFTYNLPLLEVPGPEGGYPLSLSYHAGIMPNEEASWVGLGWTLNPGAINRTVNGFPDDHLNATRVRRDVWSGGKRHTLSVGVGLPGVSYNLALSFDSNRGFGVGSTVGAGVSIGGENGVSVGLSLGNMPYEDWSVQPNIGFKVASIANGQGQISASTNFKSVSFSASSKGSLSRESDNMPFDYTPSKQYMGVSLSSKGLKPSLSVAGISASQSNGNAGRVQVSGWGISLPLQLIGLPITLGYNYMRYYSDEKDSVYAVGPLHFDAESFNSDDNALDSYSFPDDEFKVNQDPEKERGGSLPSYDAFNVNAQGLSGSMQPYVFENGSLFRQNIANQQNSSENLVSYTRLRSFQKPVNFRFNNDFSNKLTYSNSPEFVVDGGQGLLENHEQELFSEYFNSTTNHLEGSKHIEWFTNEDISHGTAQTIGFMDYPGASAGGKVKYRTSGSWTQNQINEIKDQIGGFMITNESGMTYHYALPSYIYDQYSKSFLSEDSGTYVEYEEDEPYASHWLLTAITGPDFVDTNYDGVVSDGDWGYWVKFDYGLWSDNYRWANPMIDTHIDLDQKSETFSRGKKELYFLNSISTRSHIAVFEKEIRNDGKGLAHFGANGANEIGVYQETSPATYYKYPTSSLKLKRVLLFDKSVLSEQAMESLKDDANDYNHIFNFGASPNTISQRVHFGDNVIDVHDIAANSNLIDNATRVIELVHDYELVDETTNSFELAYTGAPSTTAHNTKTGKLTLKKVKMLGKGGAAVLPPIDFEYADNPDYNEDAVDVWGMYKSDYNPSSLISDQNIKNIVTPTSALNKAAWSLTSITTSLGASIDVTYESDDYSEVGIENFPSLQITDLERQQYTTNEFLLTLNEVPGNLNELRGPGNTGEFVLGYLMAHMNESGTFVGGGDEARVNRVADIEILQINSNSIRVRSNELNAIVSNREEVTTTVDLGWKGLIGGNLFLNVEGINKNGGGLRVKHIAVNTPDTDITNYTHYDYRGSGLLSSGVTSYEPNRADLIDFFNYSSELNMMQAQAKINFENEYGVELGSSINQILSLSRELPSPGVLYGKVTVSESIKHGSVDSLGIPGKKVYEFQTFEPTMVERVLDDENGEDEILNETETIWLPPKASWENYCYNSIEDDLAQYDVPIDFSYANLQCSTAELNAINADPQDDDEFLEFTYISSTRTITKFEPITIKNFTAMVGSLKSVTTYGKDDVLLEKTENTYLDARTGTKLTDALNNQGLVTQLFNEKRTILNDDSSTDTLVVFTRKDEYPVVQLSSVSTNYKTGVTTVQENLEFDQLTGEPLVVQSYDTYGNTIRSVGIPAYSITQYAGSSSTAGMGPKIVNINNKHMLSQSAGQYVYKVKIDRDLPPLEQEETVGLISASIQTWDDQFIPLGLSVAQTGVWRKKASYSWVGDKASTYLRADGTYEVTDGETTDFSLFDFTNISSNGEGWQKGAEITLYDIYSHALEVKDLNDQYAATKMDKSSERVLATAALSKYSEFAFSGAEDWDGTGVFAGGVTQNQGSVVLVGGEAHTGYLSLQVDDGDKGFEFSSTDISEGTYRISLWSSEANAVDVKYQVNGGSAQTLTLMPERQAGDWYLIRGNVNVPPSTTSFNIYAEGKATTYIDDFRFHPLQSAMTSYVYNKWGELSHILDANNLYTEYRYDAAGRLREVYTERLGHGKVKLSAGELNYQKSTN